MNARWLMALLLAGTPFAAQAAPLNRGENPRQVTAPAPAAGSATPAAAAPSSDVATIRKGLAARDAAIAQFRTGGISPAGANITAVAPNASALAAQFSTLRQTVDQIAAADAAAPPGNARPGPPIIISVDGHASGAQVTPGAHVTIRGYGFAPAGGTPTARLVSSQFGPYGGQIALNIDSADNGKIVADLPANVSGVLDDPAATVQVTTTTGARLQSAPVQFVAERETVGWILFKNNSAPQLKPYFNTTWKPAGTTPYRYAEGENIDCPAQGGGDEIQLVGFRPGFFVSEAAMIGDRTDAGDGDGFGDAGSRTVFGQYALQITNGAVYASWAVWRSHRSPIEPIPGVTLQDPQDICLSNYTLEIYVTGPAGLTAW